MSIYIHVCTCICIYCVNVYMELHCVCDVCILCLFTRISVLASSGIDYDIKLWSPTLPHFDVETKGEYISKVSICLLRLQFLFVLLLICCNCI